MLTDRTVLTPEGKRHIFAAVFSTPKRLVSSLQEKTGAERDQAGFTPNAGIRKLFKGLTIAE
jgi:hypothetical protein